jgi:endonuclease/exonuclease/phosphatase family metal-dependent hydrolase
MPGVIREPELRDWLDSPARRVWFTGIAQALAACATHADRQASALWRAHGGKIEELLATVQAGAAPPAPPAPSVSSAPSAPACPRDRLRVVHWNIYRGIALDEIAARLQTHPDLRDADLILLNEVDVGMARSANRHVARELARCLGMHWAFVPSYLELTKGIDDDLRAPGENAIGLHGVALLSRSAPLALRAVTLPESFDTFDFSEKRYGRRTALLAAFENRLCVAAVHLEVRGTPRGRARQMAALLAGIEDFVAGHGAADAGAPRILIGGDFNTHTFARGGFRNAAGGLLRILATPRAALAQQLLEPWRAHREPLFDALRERGYAWERLNDRRPTASERLDRVEETGLLAGAVRRRLLGERGLGRRVLALRLDWFAGRDVEPRSGTVPRSVGELPAGWRPSDHLPIVLDLEWPDAAVGSR